MERAIALALENVRSGGGPFGALIVKDGKILSEAANCVTVENDPTHTPKWLRFAQLARNLGISI